MARARAARDVTRAVREDLERGAEADVTTAYDAFETARAAYDLDRHALLVAQENFRVQDTRYRAGATAILDLLAAQDQPRPRRKPTWCRSRYATRLCRRRPRGHPGSPTVHDRIEP